MGAVRKIGQEWYIRYCEGGQRFEEKVPVKTKHEAQACLRARLNKIDTGEFRPESLTVRVRDLYKLIQDNYFIKGQRAEDLPKRWKHLEPVFGQRKAREVNESAIAHYSAQRLTAGATPATVQRELSCLRRMFRLGLKQHLLTTIPTFEQIEQNGKNARQGFFEDVDFQKVCAVLPIHLQVLTTVAYWTGARKGELLKLQWRHVDLKSGKVQLEAGMVKSKHARSFFLPPDALAALQRWRRVTTEWELKNQCKVPTVFHLNGNPIRDFRGAWDHAFEVAGVARKLFHDLRRSSVRNYVRSGVPKSVCRSISGHLTDSIFDRYDIQDDADKQAAAQAIAQRLHEARNGEAMGKEPLYETV
jgi:integrase